MHRKASIFTVVAGVTSSVLAIPVSATIRTMTGVITVLGVQSTTGNIPEVVDIVLDQPLAATGCPSGTRGFEFDSVSVSDANTRKNMLAVLIGAKLSGATITINYDDGGSNCSTHGFTVPYGISL